MQQHINSQIKSREAKMAFRTDGERVVLTICQALCSRFQTHFRSRNWKGCNPCPENRLTKHKNGGTINLNENIVLGLFPAEGRIEVKKNGQLETWRGISAFSVSYSFRICRVCFFNSQKRPILVVDQFGSTPSV